MEPEAEPDKLNFKNIEDKKLTDYHKIEKITRIKDEIKIDKETSDNLFKLYWFEIIFVMANCGCKRFRDRRTIIKAGNRKFFFYLDVHSYIKKMQEIDLLKYLLFNKEELYLFNFLSKPLISTKDITHQAKIEFDEEQNRDLNMTNDDIVKLYNAYNSMSKNVNSDSNFKLINLVDAEVESLRD